MFFEPAPNSRQSSGATKPWWSPRMGPTVTRRRRSVTASLNRSGSESSTICTARFWIPFSQIQPGLRICCRLLIVPYSFFGTPFQSPARSICFFVVFRLLQFFVARVFLGVGCKALNYLLSVSTQRSNTRYCMRHEAGLNGLRNLPST